MRGWRLHAAVVATIMAAALFGCGGDADDGGGAASGSSETQFDAPAESVDSVEEDPAEQRFQRRLRPVCRRANVQLHPPMQVDDFADRERLARIQLAALDRFIERASAIRPPATYDQAADEFLGALESSRQTTDQLIEKAAAGIEGEVGLLIEAQQDFRDVRAEWAERMGLTGC